MQSLWFGIAVAAVVVLNRQSRAATPAGLAKADGTQLCEKAFALTRLGEVGLEAARQVEALEQTARANAATIAALVAAASTQGEPTAEWEAEHARLTRRKVAAEDAAKHLTLIAGTTTQQAVAAARTGADLSGFLLVLAAVGTGGSSGKSCLVGDEQKADGDDIKTNAHYILAKTCETHVSLLKEQDFDKLREAVMRPVALNETGGKSENGRIGTARQGRADECALLALSQARTAGSNGLLIANEGRVDEDETGNATKERSNKKITLGSCIEVTADSSGGIKWVDGTVKHGAKSTTDMLDKIEEALNATAKARGPCAQHNGACEPSNVAELLKAISAARASKPNPANASI
ncbi:hypothetical protein, conserved in T. vivax, partial [Trypanosoma vivax Y486]